jgi:hypothetical protein
MAAFAVAALSRSPQSGSLILPVRFTNSSETCRMSRGLSCRRCMSSRSRPRRSYPVLSSSHRGSPSLVLVLVLTLVLVQMSGLRGQAAARIEVGTPRVC